MGENAHAIQSLEELWDDVGQEVIVSKGLQCLYSAPCV
jgi:hypothetical protein